MEKSHINKEHKVFFTSDLHIGHSRIIDFTGRPYNDVKEMNDALIGNWNKVVSPEGIVFLLGDIIWSDSSHEFNRLMRKLNGTKHIIMGNHDSKKALRNLPENCILHDDIVHLWVDGTKIEFVLSHYPLYSWQGIQRGVINLHGHIHSGENSHNGFDTAFVSNYHYDIGVDNNDYYPVELDKLIEKINILRSKNLPQSIIYSF